MGYYKYIRSIIFKFPAETAHHMAIRALKSGLVPRPVRREYPELRMTLWNTVFPNVVGMAAGFDKNAEVIDPLFKQGFGFVEVGTVTPLPQAGNPLPRLFRLEEDEAIINRMGFNNQGAGAFIRHLEAWGEKVQGYEGVLGANIGKNKDTVNAVDDYVSLLEKVYGLSDYITINISSPNTPGLRAMQRREELGGLLHELVNARSRLIAQWGHIPLLVKIAPDTTPEEREDIAEVVLKHQIDGLIVSNTTIGERENLRSKHKNETGGLSGAPLFTRSTQALRDMYRLTEGKIPLIGVGGIRSGADAYAKIKAGASLVQIYSALIYQGFEMVEQVKRDLIVLLKKDGFTHINQAIGVESRKEFTL